MQWGDAVHMNVQADSPNGTLHLG